MSYEIVITDEADGLRFCHVTSTIFKTWKLWRVQYHDGNESILYKCGAQWMQWSKTYLNKQVLYAIGNCIDEAGNKKTRPLPDHYFYDVFGN